tara:strand:- start:609 stop:1277 length:669 start_codon:yes stop_codon:yes gene_type:complete
MIRQDKIAYLITGFNSLGKKPLYPKDNPMECLIRTILSQGTRDENRDIAMTRLLASCPAWDNVSSLKNSDLTAIIKPAGLATRKSETIKSFLEWCKSELKGYDLKPMSKWSTKRIMNSLCSIKGIGVKTAAIFCCFSLRRAVFPVDVHVHRMLTRVGITSRRLSPEQVFNKVDSYIPYGKDYFLHCHIIDHGRHICKKRPLCDECMFAKHCDYNLNKNDWVN